MPSKFVNRLVGTIAGLPLLRVWLYTTEDSEAKSFAFAKKNKNRKGRAGKNTTQATVKPLRRRVSGRLVTLAIAFGAILFYAAGRYPQLFIVVPLNQVLGPAAAVKYWLLPLVAYWVWQYVSAKVRHSIPESITNLGASAVARVVPIVHFRVSHKLNRVGHV